MNLNLITKPQLRDFVDRKIRTRKADLSKEIQVTVTEKMGLLLTELLGNVSEIERISSKFEDLITTAIHLIGSDSVPEYSKTAVSAANKLCKAHSYFLEDIVRKAMNALDNPNRTYYQFSNNTFQDAVDSLYKELKTKIDLRKHGLDKLQTELNTAISNESKGKQAYNALIALGMDMKDLPEANPNLPMITKLSIDVCILNGNCEEKAS